ncbi:methyltransferase [Sphingomonas sp. LR61]
MTTDAAEAMFRNAATVLQPGGELWCVWNGHLRYRPVLERLVGPTRQVLRTPKFTVTASVAAPH